MPDSNADLSRLPIETLKKMAQPLNYLKDQVPTEEVDRFSFRLDVYWDSVSGDPVGQSFRGHKLLGVKDVEPYVRKVKVTTDERDLPLGDIPRSNVGYLILVNLEGTRTERIPTKEERLEISKRIVLFNGYEIHPFGMVFFGHPAADKPLKIKSLYGTVSLQTCIYPK